MLIKIFSAGNNKPIRLQIITHNGSASGVKGAQLSFKTSGSPKKAPQGDNKEEQNVAPKTNSTIVKDLGDISLGSENKETSKSKEEEKKEGTAESKKETAPMETEKKKPLSDGPRTPQNQPLYARHRLLHPSPSKEKKNLKDKPTENSGSSEFDSYKMEPNFPGEGNAPTMTQNKMQALKRDPRAIATISESELAFLTRPTNNTGNWFARR